MCEKCVSRSISKIKGWEEGKEKVMTITMNRDGYQIKVDESVEGVTFEEAVCSVMATMSYLASGMVEAQKDPEEFMKSFMHLVPGILSSVVQTALAKSDDPKAAERFSIESAEVDKATLEEMIRSQSRGKVGKEKPEVFN